MSTRVRLSTSTCISTINGARPLQPYQPQWQQQRQFSKLSPQLKHSEYDVLICGGGMVGSALACALASNSLTRSLRVALLESQPPSTKPFSPLPSIRVSAITPTNAAFFESMGAWQEMKNARVTPYHDMQIWHHSNRGQVHWRASDVDRTDLGYIVENDVIQSSLFKRLATLREDKQCEAAEVLAPVKVEGIEPSSTKTPDNNSLPQVVLSNGQRVTARLLIGADGGNSSVKSYAGISSVGTDYNQKAVVATVETAAASSTAYQRFLPNGPVALLPCHGNYSNVVWSTTLAQAHHLCQISPQQFLSDLNNAFHAAPAAFQPNGRPSMFEHLLPKSLREVLPVLLPDPTPSPPLVMAVHGPRLSFPLRLIHTTSYVRPHLALIGDSAHVVHPLAGQGVNLGLGDAAELAHQLQDAIANGQPWDNYGVLQRYESSRSIANLQMMTAVHTIGGIFRVSDGFPALLRGVGMDIFNNIPAIKNQASKHAMGIL